MDKIYRASPYILEWLIKNNYNIEYIAPILYLRENIECHYDKLNMITYREILNNKPIIIDKLYALNKIGGFNAENPIIKEVSRLLRQEASDF